MASMTVNSPQHKLPVLCRQKNLVEMVRGVGPTNLALYYQAIFMGAP